MIRGEIMKNKHQEKRALRDPLFFTIPVYGLVTALSLDWLGEPERGSVAEKREA
jgi:hypothetical protein